jgi:succinyl-diaminopimelate desuccinylase
MLDEKILAMKDEIVASVQSALKIRSVEEDEKNGTPFGEGIQKALEHCLKLSETLGFKTVNLDNMIGYAEYGEGNEMVAVLGHLDVVPEGNGWTYPPYAAEIHDGKIFGRGATDDKGPTIGALYALKAIKDLRLPLKRRVRIMFGLNEESGSKCVAHYVVKGGEKPVAGFTPDAEYPIINGEKGIVTCRYRRAFTQAENFRLESISGGIASNVVPDYAEAVIIVPASRAEEIKAKAKNADRILSDRISTQKISAESNESAMVINASGVSAHGSTPEKGVNAVSLLLEFLYSLSLPGELGEFFDFTHNFIGLDFNGEKLGIYSEDKISGKFVFNLGVIGGNDNEIFLEMNMRYPVTHTYEEFIDIFKAKMNSGKMEEIYLRHKKSLYVSPETPFIKKLQKVYEEKTGDKADLVSIGGGTYAKALDNVVAFGPIFRGQPMVEHKPDEYIKIDELIKNVQIMAAAIYELAT